MFPGQFSLGSTPLGKGTGSVKMLRPVGIPALLGLLAWTGAIAAPGAAVAAPMAVAPVVSATIPVGTLPSGVEDNPVTNTAYVANFGDNTVSVINGRTNTVTGTIAVGAGPEQAPV